MHVLTSTTSHRREVDKFGTGRDDGGFVAWAGTEGRKPSCFIKKEMDVLSIVARRVFMVVCAGDGSQRVR